MFEIGIPNFIKTSEYKSDPIKYNYFRTYNKGKYTLLVSHNGEFFSFLDIASTLKKFGILSLFMIISKDEKKDEYTFLIGNSFYPYEKTLLNKSIVKKDDTFNVQLQKTKKFIDMIKRMLDTQNIIVFPIDIKEEEITELLGNDINYQIMDITKYLFLTPVTMPKEKKIVPIFISILIVALAYIGYEYIDEYYNYTYKPKLQMKERKLKHTIQEERKKLQKIIQENDKLKLFLKDKSRMKIYRGQSSER